MTSLPGSRFPERPAPTYTLSEGAIGRERASNPKAQATRPSSPAATHMHPALHRKPPVAGGDEWDWLVLPVRVRPAGSISCALFILAWAAWLVLTAWVGAVR